jgi:hypothetical protein
MKLYTSDCIPDEAITTCRRATGSHELSVSDRTDTLSSKSIVMLTVDERTSDPERGSWVTTPTPRRGDPDEHEAHPYRRKEGKRGVQRGY